MRGDLVLNGLTTSSADLSERLAYVQRDCNLCGDMTVRQTLLFTALLQAPGRPNRNIDTKGRVRHLVSRYHVVFVWFSSRLEVALESNEKYLLLLWYHRFDFYQLFDVLWLLVNDSARISCCSSSLLIWVFFFFLRIFWGFAEALWCY